MLLFLLNFSLEKNYGRYLPQCLCTEILGASYFIITYFIAELTYAIVSLMDPFSIGQTAHFAHVGGFIAGAVLAVMFKAVRGSSYKNKKK